MDHEALEKRKKTIYSLLCDDFYVPMKAKEMAMLLQIPKSQRAELQEVLDALVADGKADVSKKGKYSKAKPVYLRVIQKGLDFYGWKRARISIFRNLKSMEPCI